MSVLDKLKKASTIKETSVLSKSKFFTEKDMIQTDVPIVNVALSGNLDGGLTPGLTMFAGPSKHFKTAFALLMAKSYMNKYDDAVVLFYDSEFGTPQSYFDAFGIDTERVLHTPITDVEQLKHDIMNQLQVIEKGERVVGVSGMAGTELLRLANLNEMEVSIEINEIDVVKLHLQDSAMVNVEAYPNETFKGIVTEIANSSQNTNSLEQVTNFVVKVRLIQESYRHLMDHSENSPFRPGMSANVTIMTRHKNNCLSLPIAAVVSKDQSEARCRRRSQCPHE